MSEKDRVMKDDYLWDGSGEPDPEDGFTFP